MVYLCRLWRFLNRQALPAAPHARRTSGVCAVHQRELVEAIKRARNIALLPFATD